MIRSTRVLFSLNHLGMNLLCERFIKSFLLFFLSILLYFFLSLSFSWPRRVKSWKLGENKKLFKIPSELLSNALIMAATKTFVIQDLDSDSYGNEQRCLPELSAQRGVCRAVCLWWSCCGEASGLGRRQWITKRVWSPRGVNTALPDLRT